MATQRHSNMWPGTLKTSPTDEMGISIVKPRFRAMMIGVLLMTTVTNPSDTILKSSEQSYLSSPWSGVVEHIADNPSAFGINSTGHADILTWFNDPESNCSYAGTWPGISVKVKSRGWSGCAWGSGSGRKKIRCMDFMELYCRFFVWRKRQMRRIYLPGPDGARPERGCGSDLWTSRLSPGPGLSAEEIKFSVYPGKLSWYINPLCFHWVSSVGTINTAESACDGLPSFRIVSLR